MSRCFNRFMQHLTIDFTGPFKESQHARILVVEDDQFIRELYAIILRMNGYDIATAVDGVDALERLADEPFDLVLTDRSLPKIDGPGIVLALRSAGSRTPVIMISGSLEYAPLPPAVARELSAAIQKPAGIPELLSAIARSLPPRPLREDSREFRGVAELAA